MANAHFRLLCQALQTGITDSVQSLLTRQVFSTDQLNAAAVFIMHIYDQPSHTHCLRLLLTAGAFLRTRDRTGRSLLLLAAARGLVRLVEELVAKGCDIQEQDLQRKSALHLAMDAEECTDTVRTLLRLGANWKLKDAKGNTALHLAALNGRTDALFALLEAGCRPDVFNSDSDSPLHFAIRNSNERCVEVLLKHGANPAALNKLQQTPISLATSSQLALIRQLTRKENNKWTRSRTAPSATLPDIEVLEAAENLQTLLIKEKLAKEEIEVKTKTLTTELQQVRQQIEQTKETLAQEQRLPVSSCLYLTHTGPAEMSDLLSHLGVELMRFSVEVEAWQRSSEVHFRDVISMLRKEVKSVWPSADIETFGSFAVLLHLPYSTLDLIIVNIPKDIDKITALERLLSKHPNVHNLITGQNSPFPTISAIISGLPVILTREYANNPGLATVRFTKDLLQKMPLLRPLVLATKHLFQCCRAADQQTGGISAYALLVMIAVFLQEHPGLVDLAEAFYSLMHYYAWEFAYDTAITLRSVERQLLPEVVPDVLSVQDPVQPEHDLGHLTDLSAITVPLTQTIFRLAFKQLRISRACQCPQSNRVFLRLLQETQFYLSHICP